ncbi:hypothetical protein [Paracoccus litorisediminis]|uniref:Uncharacterized protein n=1 Tax=Paracoccus litorisediminis TaxID=2006130 RepID=A0A844HM58_9RHOB|nr:hypothetical protein [Paracoccus litorisediminis]MTH61373.1 hypothetical protein [Paracoccus litorisediminis]
MIYIRSPRNPAEVELISPPLCFMSESARWPSTPMPQTRLSLGMFRYDTRMLGSVPSE